MARTKQELYFRTYANLPTVWTSTALYITTDTNTLYRRSWSAYTEVWQAGDLDWPASSTDNAIARFDWTTWKLLQNSLVLIDDKTMTRAWLYNRLKVLDDFKNAIDC